jgi:hypothetical protein
MSRYSESQTHQVMDAFEAAGYTPQELTKLGQYRALGDFRLVLNGLGKIVRNAVVETLKEKKIFFRRVCVVKLGSTDSAGTYYKVRRAFNVALRAILERFGIVLYGIAPEMKIAVDELILDGKFSDFIGNTTEELEKRRLLGAQLVKFFEDYPDKLHKKCHAMLSVLTENDKPVVPDLANVFVAEVYMLEDNKLSVNMYRFNDDRIFYYAEDKYRFLYPIR